MSSVKSPQNLRIYQGESERIKVFHFTLQFDSHATPSLYDYELQIDSIASFDSINLKTYFQNDVLEFQNGDVVKGYEIELSKRQLDKELNYYCRVRINGGGFKSAWTSPVEFSINQNYSKTLADKYFEELADDNIYPKSVKSTNAYYLLRSFGKEEDLQWYELDKLRRNILLRESQDSTIYDYFGYLVGYKRPLNTTAVEYKERVIQLWDKFINYPATVYGLEEIIKMWTVETPLIYPLVDQQDWVLGESYLYDSTYLSLTPYIQFNSLNPPRGHRVIIYIYNSWGFTLDTEIIERYIKLFIPYQVHVTIEYITQKTKSVFYDLYEDWNTFTKTNLDIETEQDSVLLEGSNLTGKGDSPIIDLGNIYSFSTLEAEQELDSGTITYYMKSSSDLVTWSDWETVTLDNIPSNVFVRRYIQIRFDISRTSVSQNPKLESLRFNYRSYT